MMEISSDQITSPSTRLGKMQVSEGLRVIYENNPLAKLLPPVDEGKIYSYFRMTEIMPPLGAN